MIWIFFGVKLKGTRFPAVIELPGIADIPGFRINFFPLSMPPVLTVKLIEVIVLGKDIS
jgi:hypothetical protein